MNAAEFVEQLKGSAPTEKEILKRGLDRAFAKDWVSRNTCTPRKPALKLKPIAGSEHLIDLFSKWKTGKIEIGMITLADTPAKTPRGMKIGADEGSPLLIAPDGEIVVEEYGTNGHRLGIVAKDGNHFLEAMVIAAKFLNDRGIGSIDFEDFPAAKAAAKKCGTAAGGEKYIRFFHYLLGADE